MLGLLSEVFWGWHNMEKPSKTLGIEASTQKKNLSRVRFGIHQNVEVMGIGEVAQRDRA